MLPWQQPYPMGEIPTLCSLQPRNVPSLRIHSNEQETCIQHLKTYQAQNKQVMRPSTKRSAGKNPEHLFFSQMQIRLQGQLGKKHQEHLPQAAQAPAVHRMAVTE